MRWSTVFLFLGMAVVHGQQEEFRLLFGSCNKQDRPQPLWPVLKNRPSDVFIWLGDNIYADHAVTHTLVVI